MIGSNNNYAVLVTGVTLNAYKLCYEIDVINRLSDRYFRSSLTVVDDILLIVVMHVI